MAAGAYALVILDLGLPRKSGLELLKEMRRAGNLMVRLHVDPLGVLLLDRNRGNTLRREAIEHA